MMSFLFNIVFATATHAMLVRFSEDPEVARDVVHLEEDLEEDEVGVISDSLNTCTEGGLGHVVGRRLSNCV